MRIMKKSLPVSALSLAILLDLGCGGTMDLSKPHGTAGAESASGAAGYIGIAGGPDGISGVPGVGGAWGSSGGPFDIVVGGYADNGGWPGSSNAGYPGNGGAESYAGSPGNAGWPGTSGALGYAGGYPGNGGSSGANADPGGKECGVDADCVECAAQTDPAISGCYTPCCESTALNGVTCSHHWQTYFATCPKIVCALECVTKPQPLCVSGQCVHGH